MKLHLVTVEESSSYDCFYEVKEDYKGKEVVVLSLAAFRDLLTEKEMLEIELRMEKEKYAD